MENIQIANAFEETADLLEIQGANPFRVRAYRNAARTIGTLGTPVETMLKHDGHALQELPGIGADLAGKIGRMCRTGEFALLRLRENRGEIEAARAGRLPRLVEVADIRGDLQMHTDATDGRNTLAEMVAACEVRGYEYVAITDHTKAVRVAGGLSAAGFHKQSRAIDALRKRVSKPFVLKGVEVDILEDGTLDLNDATLAEFDIVIAAVHSRFNMSSAEMTRRIVRAVQHPRVHILGHPTGWLLGKREPYPLDMTEVIKAARDHGVLLEINAQPDRLDLNDLHSHMAREAGVTLVISTDVHRIQELDCMRFGVDQARRGWCEAKDVANTSHLAALQKLIRK